MQSPATMEYVNPPMKMVEFVCEKRITFIANMTLDEFVPIANASRQLKSTKELHTKVIMWAMRHTEERECEFTYKHAAGKSFGRMTSNSMMGIPRDIRGFVCVSEDTGHPLLTDLDMDNCHPQILQWLCEKHQINCPAITEYVLNRQRHKQEWMDSTGRSADEVKSMFLSAVNSHNESWCPNLTPFFVQLDKECKGIQQAFLQLLEYRHLLSFAEAAANEKLQVKKAELRRERKTTNGLTANVAGSFINLVLCTWENRFLGEACKTAQEMGYRVCVNNFDGFMIQGNHYPNGTATVKDDIICPALERALHQAFGVTMGWSMKRHSSVLVYLEDGLQLPYSQHSKPWLEKICRVGCEYLVKLSTGGVVFEGRNELTVRLNAETAKCIMRYPGAPSWYTLEFPSTLMKDPKMRTYELAECFPNVNKCPPDVYNLWERMPCEEWNTAEADPNSEHVKQFRFLARVLADNNAKLARFIELFIAHMLKFPDVKPGAWLVFMSEEGAGKGTLIACIRLLVGSRKVSAVNNVGRSLLGSFNQVLLDAFLIVLDESSSKHLYDGAEELKNLITESEVKVNQKNVKEKTVQSYARFISTIQPRSIPTKKGDRRGVICRCSDELIGNTEFFTDINKRMEDPQFARDIHAYLMTLSPPKVFTAVDLPQTDLQKVLQDANADIFEQWLNEVVSKWMTDEDDELKEYNRRRITTNLTPTFTLLDLFKSYREYAEQANALRLVENVTFKTFVAKFSLCAWRKSFDYKPNGKDYPRHKVGGQQKLCRQWDMKTLARELRVEMPASHAEKRKAEQDEKKDVKRQFVQNLLRQNSEQQTFP